MSQKAENFTNNVRLLLAHKSKTQTELAKILGVPKTTVSKWLTDIVEPREKTIDEIIKKFNESKLCGTFITKDMLLCDVYAFASAIGAPLYKAHSVTSKQVMYSNSLVFNKDDRTLSRIVGVYKLFYPSVVYNGAFFCAAIRIVHDQLDGMFYFESKNNSSNGSIENDWSIQRLYQFGSVGRIGDKAMANAILVGDLIGENHENLANVRFTSFKIPASSNPDFLLGTTIGLDFDERSIGYGYLLPTPIVAISVGEASDEKPVIDFAPHKAYFSLSEMKESFPKAIELLKNIPQAWCFNGIHLED